MYGLVLRRLQAAAASPTDVTDANIRRLVAEITWYGVLVGTTINLIQVYVVRLGASSLLLGAVTYGAALVSILWQLPAGRLMAAHGRRMRWVVNSLLVHRLLYLAIALLPFFITRALAEVTVLLIVLQAFPLAASNTSFLAMMADMLPPQRTTQVVGWRMAGLGVTSTLSTLAAGRILQRLAFPLNYQTIFLIGFAASLVSLWYVRRLHVVDPPPRRSEKALLGDVGRMLQRPGYAAFLLIACLSHVVIGMIAPLLPLYWVRLLAATDGQISILVTAASAAGVVGALSMQRLVGRIGRVWALALAPAGYALYPLLTSLSPSIWWLIPWAMMAGFFISALYTTLFSNLVALTPDQERTEYVSLYNMALFSGMFIGPIISGILAEVPGGVVIGLRLAAGVGFAAALWAISQRRLLLEAGRRADD
ncbi:MAG: Major Facilitator Superfamily protein [Chloroflexi bacterium ADurb.Bin325]|nr:MAG: Major Facilitator Superfamily protein [Chloroflexi bacterium ADurb.Bin325]